MSATITDLNARYRDNVEKLLAASSKIIQLEALVEAANALMKAKDVQIEALKAICEATIGMLDAARPMFPEDLLPALDRLLSKARVTLALVKP
jgi:hypothetical protein